jgi:hypothetical protein
MSERHSIALELLQRGPHPIQHVGAMRDVLPDATFTDPDPETGFFEIQLEADSYDDALQEVIDAIAAAGADDHVVVAEHP